MFVNKAVVGSGSEGAPKYVGEGVTYRGIFRVLIAFFCMCAPLDMPHQNTRTLSYVIMMLHVMR